MDSLQRFLRCLAAEPGNEQRCLDESLKPSEVLSKFSVPFVSSF